MKTRIPRRFGLDPIRDIQVLCPMNRGGVGARSLNIELQAALNPAGEREGREVRLDLCARRQGHADRERLRQGGLQRRHRLRRRCRPRGGRAYRRLRRPPVVYDFGELDTLVPAYAATIHKSQGSEYPAVVIPVMTQHYPMLQRNLLYTGVTRGKSCVVLVGQKRAVAMADRNASGRRRCSKLDVVAETQMTALPAENRGTVP